MCRLWVAYVYVGYLEDDNTVERIFCNSEAQAEKKVLELIERYKGTVLPVLPGVLYYDLTFDGLNLCASSPVLYVSRLAEQSPSEVPCSASTACKVIEIAEFKRRKRHESRLNL